MVDELADIQKSYLDALEVLEYKMIMGSNTLISIDDIRAGNSREFFKMMDYTESILNSIRLLDREKVRTQIEKWFQSMGEAKIPRDMINQLSTICNASVENFGRYRYCYGRGRPVRALLRYSSTVRVLSRRLLTIY